MRALGTAAITAAVLLVSGQVLGQPPGDLVEGLLTQLSLTDTPRTIRVKTPRGEIVAEIGPRTLVVFEGSAARFPAAPELSSLRPGMTVRLASDAQGVARIHVIDLPEDGRADSKDAASPPRAARTVKARLRDLRYDTRRRRGEVTADVEGRRESFAAMDASLFRRFRRGDLVLIGVAKDGSVVSMEPARLQGRVTRVDARRLEVTVELEGRPEAFAIAQESLLERLRAGDVIRFDVEERAGGRRVITAVH